MELNKSLDFVKFFTQVGLTQETSFASEFFRRWQEKWLPPLRGPQDVLRFLNQKKNRDAISLKSVFSQENCETLIRPQLQVSFEVLNARIAGLGLDPVIIHKLHAFPENKQSFLQILKTKNLEEAAESVDAVERALACIRTLREEQGTSIALTYKLFVIEELISRLKLVVLVLQQRSADEFQNSLIELVNTILVKNEESYKVRDFLVQNVEILAYQVTLLTSITGENYISNHRKDLLKMWWKAIKGAMVVAVLAFLKVLVSKLSYPPLVQGLLFGSIYAAGFVVIHLLGGVLATKQPAMTAATIASELNHVNENPESLRSVIETIVRLLRTQIAALMGNYIFAFPFAVILVFPFLVIEHPLAGFDKAKILVEDLHPFWSLSFVYAAIAGVCLFLSGLIAGLADNWFSYQQISHRLVLLIGSERGRRFAKSAKKNFGIIMGNIVLGFMLGSMSSVGRVLGIPLDIRHVTFASAAFGIGWIHQPERMPWGDFAVIAVSIFVMGLVNLAVSFSLSLTVAMQSRKLKFSQGRALIWELTKRVARRPQDLFWDPVRPD